MVDNISYSDLAAELFVKPQPGRKNAGPLSKQSIRNYINVIQSEFSDHFKVITEGQKLKFQFPTLPKMLKNALANTEANTEINTAIPLTNTEQNEDLTCEDNIEVNTDLYLQPTSESAVKNNINNNKLTNTTNCSTQFSHGKKSISKDFYPSADTILAANARGFHKVTDSQEIQAFIAYNQKYKTAWADFNPIFINWLERGALFEERQQLKNQHALNQSRSSYACGSNQRVPQRSTISETMELNKGAIHPGTGKPTAFSGSPEGLFEAIAIPKTDTTRTLDVDLAELDEFVWSTVCQQARPERQRYLA